jgi:transcriptional regulator with XRE-family HTH domain
MILGQTKIIAISPTENGRLSNKPMKDEAFARRFQSLVEEAGAPKTLKELGRWLGVSTTMAWLYRHGENVPSMETTRYMAQKLGCSVEYLLTGRGQRRPLPEASAITERFALLIPRHQDAVAAVIESLLASQTPEDCAAPTPSDETEPERPVRPS